VDNSTFEIACTAEIQGSPVRDSVRIDYEILLRNKVLEDLVIQSHAKIFIAVYCSETLFKCLMPIHSLVGSLDLPAGSVVGNLEVEPILVSTTKISAFHPQGINLEYAKGYFEIEAGSPLAIGEREIFPIQFVRRSFQDLIRVQTSHELHKDEYEISLESNVITINMGVSVRQAWELMSADITLRPYLFISIYKDTLVEALNAIIGGQDVGEFAWSQKLGKTFERVGLDIFSESDFSKINRAVLRLLGDKGVERIISNVQ
jgi:hypothetical protein